MRFLNKLMSQRIETIVIPSGGSSREDLLRFDTGLIGMAEV